MTEIPKKSVASKDLFVCDVPYILPLLEAYDYPWEILPRIKAYIAALIEAAPADFSEYAPGVLVGENVEIHPSAVIGTNIVIGSGTKIGPGAYLRENVLTGPDCRIGNASELKNCVLLRHAQAPHYNYVGDSVLGTCAHLGAGAVCSNLKSDGKNVVVHGEEEYETDLRKVGAFLGDGAEIGCHCVLNPGTVVGAFTSVYPLTSLRGVIPSHCIVKSPGTVIAKKEK